MNLAINPGAQENALINQEEFPSENTLQEQANKAFPWIRKAANLGGYLGNAAFFINKPFDTVYYLEMSDKMTTMTSIGNLVGLARVAYSLSYLIFTLYDLQKNFKDDLTEAQKQEIREASVQRGIHGAAHLIRGVGESIPLFSILVPMYDITTYFASNEAREYSSFWADESIGKKAKLKDFTSFELTNGPLFGKKVNSLGMIPIVGFPIGFVRIFAALYLQSKTTLNMVINSRDEAANQEEVKKKFVTESYYNLAHFSWGLGETFTWSIGCIVYELLKAPISQETKGQNPQIPNFFK